MRKNRNGGYQKLTVWNDAIHYYVITFSQTLLWALLVSPYLGTSVMFMLNKFPRHILRNSIP